MKSLTITLTQGDLEFLEEVVEFFSEILDAVDDDEDDE